MPLLRSRALRSGAVVLAGVLSAAVFHVPILREIASFLIVEDSLRPAAAIVALGGQTPFREMEAATFYRSGFATQVFIVREAPNAESDALKQLGIDKQQSWEVSRAVLIQQGVPPEAIVISQDEAIGTLEELQAAYKALIGQRSEVRDQRSAGMPVASQRSEVGAGEAGSREQEAWSAEERAKDEAQSGKQLEPRTTVGGHPSPGALSNATNAIYVNNAERDNAKNAINAIDAKNALPVILVTSKYHTRRTGLTWKYVSEGKSQAIVRAASRDPFDPERWWHTRRHALSVVREYLGLVNYYAGFPVGAGSN